MMLGLTPQLTAVHAVTYGVLELEFSDGLAGTVDVTHDLNGPVYEHARTQDGFFDVQRDDETHAPAWPGGADYAPDVLYERLKACSSADGLAGLTRRPAR